MAKGFNPTLQLICHLCGELYTEEKGHNPIVCENTLLERVSQLQKELTVAERQRERASLTRQRFSDGY